MDHNEQFKYFEKDEPLIFEWAKSNKVGLHKIEHVVPFVNDKFDCEIYFFYLTDIMLIDYCDEGISEKLKSKYLEILESIGYPKEYLLINKYISDSDENVQKNFAGSYFYRLR